jgi:multicomponent Na+:H+ antiporter subunit D
MLMATAASGVLFYQVYLHGEPLMFLSGGWPIPFGIVYVGDLLSSVMVIMSHIVITAGVIYAMGAKDKAIHYPAFYPLVLFLATGLTGAFLTGDLFNLFVYIELLVIAGTVLTAISDDRYGTEAAYKYFYISLLASFLLLMAIGGLYVSYGTLNMADLARRISQDPQQVMLPFSIAMLVVTFMIKGAAFPFHFWQPDFHTASPTPISALLSSVIVKLGVYGFIRMTTLLFIDFAPTIRLVLLLSGLAGLFYGGLGALGTDNVKRMLAYSTIGQIGFILIAIGWGTPLSIAAAVVFSFNHSLIKAAMLMLAGSVASRTMIKSARFSDVTGVGKYIPIAGILFFLGSLGLAGIPPTNGFISKLLVFQSGIDAQQYVTLFILGLGSVITLIYTMRAFQKIWWQPHVENAEIKESGDQLLAPLILIVLVIGFGVFAEPVINVALAVSNWLAAPGNYILAVIGGSL